MQETWVPFPSLGWEDLQEKGMATHSSIPAWRTPWTEEPGGLQSIGSQTVRHDYEATTLSKSILERRGEALTSVFRAQVSADISVGMPEFRVRALWVFSKNYWVGQKDRSGFSVGYCGNFWPTQQFLLEYSCFTLLC